MVLYLPNYKAVYGGGALGKGMNKLLQIWKGVHPQCIIGGSDSGVGIEKNEARLSELRHAGIFVQREDDASLEWFLETNGLRPEDVYLIASSRVAEDNPVRITARKHGIRVSDYQDAVRVVIDNNPVFGVAGTAGKSTTTALLHQMLRGSRFDPTLLIGADFVGTTGVYIGREPYVVAELDEFQRNYFIFYRPLMGIITNISKEHRDIGELVDDFAAFAKNTQQYVFINADHPLLEEVIRRSDAPKDKVWFYGVNAANANFRAKSIRLGKDYVEFDLVSSQHDSFHVKIPNVIGEHNVYNALGALSLALVLGVNTPTLLANIQKYPGLKLRGEIIKDNKDILVQVDFCSNPANIQSALKAFQLHGRRRTIFVIHLTRHERYSIFQDEFIDVLSDTKLISPEGVIIMTEFYGGPGNSISGEKLVQRLRERQTNVVYVSNPEQAIYELGKIVKPGDGILFADPQGSLEYLARKVFSRD